MIIIITKRKRKKKLKVTFTLQLPRLEIKVTVFIHRLSIVHHYFKWLQLFTVLTLLIPAHCWNH